MPKEITIKDTSEQELEEVLKIIHRSDYKIIEQPGQTPSKISMLSLLLCSKAHAQALIKFLKTLMCRMKFQLINSEFMWLT